MLLWFWLLATDEHQGNYDAREALNRMKDEEEL